MEKMIADILTTHKDQFIAMGLPAHLHYSACHKIASQIFDAGSFFQFQELEDDDESSNSDYLSGESLQEEPSRYSDNSNGSSGDDGYEEMGAASAVELSLDYEGLRSATSTKYSLTSCSHIDVNSGDAVLLIDHMW